ncbi:MAG TPA: aminotransferase class I/II-fold pyridoxal phosphate-dependent enzyme [Candidatus Krumholzibacteria bacterium]|nr:aminotransferase class I/II-fold pyridoxal phosphate-dependent enzyme [Candidatus Krumholzibacteria bacterium]HPD71768.1 aminotransferase class I/II-fold pyridoxal phosphate-dependent enzyme [Candidatus Krumholzibacteria bacterium]HRY41299.1 aminotransferase class I/II-fold pyridoxal phosphate-dependent enzyme [Candidatus Krumholzibacteria bacterium]
MGRLDKLPPYLFAEIDAARDRAAAQGVDVVDLGVGDPDQPTPKALVDLAAAAVRLPEHHRYPPGRGDARLRRAIAGFLRRRHGVDADPESEILVLVGSKEGIAHLPLALVAEGDNVLVPDVGYPVYTEASILAGAEPRLFPLSVDRAFLPDPRVLGRLADARTRLLWLNYPNNPTGAEAGAGLYAPLAELAEARGFVLANDAAYLEVSLDGHRPVSLLEAVDHRRQRVIEFHSFSKMFNMTGWRLGFAVGNSGVVGQLARVKQSIDSGAFAALQEVAAAALAIGAADRLLVDVMKPYAQRRRAIAAALAKAGLAVFPTQATFYVWARVPAGETSLGFCGRVLRDLGVVLTPGVGFGPGGEGWFRISLTAPDDRIAVAARRLEDL